MRTTVTQFKVLCQALLLPALISSSALAQNPLTPPQEGFFGQDTVGKDMFGNEIKKPNRPKTPIQQTNPRLNILTGKPLYSATSEQKKAEKNLISPEVTPEISTSDQNFNSVLPKPTARPSGDSSQLYSPEQSSEKPPKDYSELQDRVNSIQSALNSQVSYDKMSKIINMIEKKTEEQKTDKRDKHSF